jgi:DNA-binding transcriptional ArsR family regulator
MAGASTGGDGTDRVVMQNPNTGRDDNTIARRMYEPVRAAILSAVEDHEPLPLSELADEVERRTPDELWESASLLWYTTTVKLDLQAKGLVEAEGSPQVLRLSSSA